MEFFSCDDKEDGGHDGVGSVDISTIFGGMFPIFSLEPYHWS